MLYRQQLNRFKRKSRKSINNLSDYFKQSNQSITLSDPLKCLICNTERFYNVSALLGHYQRIGHAKKVADSLYSSNLFCDECQVQSSNKIEFKTHIKTFKHVRLTCPNPLPYYCNLCHRQFLQEKTLKRHKGSETCKISTAHPDSVFICYVCKQKFNCIRTLLKHYVKFPDHKIEPITEQVPLELSQTTLMVIEFCKFIDQDQVVI